MALLTSSTETSQSDTLFTVMLARIFTIFVFAIFSSPAFGLVNDEDWSRNVKRHNNGRVVILHIPEINQKGSYCVPGATAMVLGYFGVQLNQKRLADLFDSSITEGTYYRDMLRGFSQKKLFKDFKIQTLYNCWEIDGELDSLVSAYLQAKNKGKQPLVRDLKIMSGEGAPFAKMDPRIAKTAFVAHRKKLANFLKTTVRAHIDSGVPVLWCVYLKFDPRNGRAGGHCRVITGYIEKNGELTDFLYSDSWGAKSLNVPVAFDDALTMTTNLYLITPRTKSEFASAAQDSLNAVLPHNVLMEFVNIPASAQFPNFQIGKYEVTQQQYKTLVGKNISQTKGEDFPVEKVSWEDAMKFCERMTEYERKNGRISDDVVYTLPTRAQWAYACFAGKFPTDDAVPETEMRKFLNEHGWIECSETHGIGKKEPNEWGIYDMFGNVSEICVDATIAGLNFSYKPNGQRGKTSFLKLKDEMLFPRANMRGQMLPNVGFRVVRIKKFAMPLSVVPAKVSPRERR